MASACGSTREQTRTHESIHEHRELQHAQRCPPETHARTTEHALPGSAVEDLFFAMCREMKWQHVERSEMLRTAPPAIMSGISTVMLDSGQMVQPADGSL